VNTSASRDSLVRNAGTRLYYRQSDNGKAAEKKVGAKNRVFAKKGREHHNGMGGKDEWHSFPQKKKCWKIMKKDCRYRATSCKKHKKSGDC